MASGQFKLQHNCNCLNLLSGQECGRLSVRLEKSKMLKGGVMVSERQVRFNVNLS